VFSENRKVLETTKSTPGCHGGAISFHEAILLVKETDLSSTNPKNSSENHLDGTRRRKPAGA
jgi:hypothetical protein